MQKTFFARTICLVLFCFVFHPALWAVTVIITSPPDNSQFAFGVSIPVNFQWSNSVAGLSDIAVTWVTTNRSSAIETPGQYGTSGSSSIPLDLLDPGQYTVHAVV